MGSPATAGGTADEVSEEVDDAVVALVGYVEGASELLVDIAVGVGGW